MASTVDYLDNETNSVKTYVLDITKHLDKGLDTKVRTPHTCHTINFQGANGYSNTGCQRSGRNKTLTYERAGKGGFSTKHF